MQRTIIGGVNADAFICMMNEGWYIHMYDWRRDGPLQTAIIWRREREFQILCAAGVRADFTYSYNRDGLETCLNYNFEYGTKLLIAIGYRLKEQKTTWIRHWNTTRLVGANYTIQPKKWMYQYQSFVIGLKRKVVNLLALKRRRIRGMSHLDRFLVKELALAIWCERF
jgi:hypothetical protein